MSNEDQTLLYPNQDQPTIQKSHAQAMKNPPIDNAASVRASPNQDAISNQDMIRIQLRDM